jgi:hypothetical protein
MQQQPFNGGVRAGIGWNPNDEVGIWIALPPSCFIEIAGDGEPSSGGWMTPGMARELAFALLLQAELWHLFCWGGKFFGNQDFLIS